MSKVHPLAGLMFGSIPEYEKLKKQLRLQRDRSRKASQERVSTEPSGELARSNMEVRHLVDGTEINSIRDLEEMYRRLLNEVARLAVAGWTVRSDGRKTRLVEP